MKDFLVAKYHCNYGPEQLPESKDEFGFPSSSSIGCRLSFFGRYLYLIINGHHEDCLNTSPQYMVNVSRPSALRHQGFRARRQRGLVNPITARINVGIYTLRALQWFSINRLMISSKFLLNAFRVYLALASL